MNDSSHRKKVDILAAVVTVSSSRVMKSDKSGKTITRILKDHNIPIVLYEIVPDSPVEIEKALLDSLNVANCIIFTGGTGITSDDITIETVHPYLEKIIDGFGEYFRMKSYDEVGSKALLSRATAGIIRGKAIFCVPGSPNAARLATEDIIIPEIIHILTHASK